MLGRVEIPLRLEESFTVPALELDEVTIPAAELPLAFQIAGVRVLDDRILVSLRVEDELE